MSAKVVFSLAELVALLGGECMGDADVRVAQVAPLGRAAEAEIAFVGHVKYRAALASTRAAAVILPPSLADAFAGPRIVTADPSLYFARVAQLLNPRSQPAGGVHAAASVHSELPASVFVAAQAYVGEGCDIGENVIIGPGCVVQDRARVGAGTLLHANVTLYADCELGQRCIVHAGAVIGSDGFGFARCADGSWEKIPQIGRVIVGDDVEIGANTCIDRGALDDTVIENGVKLDNLIHIAHNCRIGENSAVAALAGFAGSSSTGKRVMIGGQAGIAGHLDICDDVLVSGHSCIIKSVTEKGVYTSTLAAQPHQEWMRNAVQIRHLNGLADRVKELEKKIADMEKKA